MSDVETRYTRLTCATCSGHGMVSDYCRNDFHGASPCPDCAGSGVVVRYPNGTLAAYPGGPFLGREAKP